MRARRQNESSTELHCFQKNANGKEAQLSASFLFTLIPRTALSLVSSSVETYSLIQDIEPPMDCLPKEITFRPDFPQQLKIRCLPFGAGELQDLPQYVRSSARSPLLVDPPKVHLTKSKTKKKRKRLDD